MRTLRKPGNCEFRPRRAKCRPRNGASWKNFGAVCAERPLKAEPVQHENAIFTYESGSLFPFRNDNYTRCVGWCGGPELREIDG